jgi:hypothetical protein
VAAFNLPSASHSTQSTIKSLFEFISDFKNFEAILPEDKVQNFSHTEDSCSFEIKGITSISIRFTEKRPYEFLHYSSEGLAKFNFHLKVYFQGDPEQNGLCRVDLSGDMNPFILKMAEKPLTAFVNSVSLKLSQLQLNT